MAAPKGHPRYGGRTKGVPNRITREVSEKLAQLKCDPISGMVRLAQNVRNRPELRGRMFAELAEYLHAKRKAIELSAPGGKPLFPLEAIREYVKQAPPEGE